MIEIWADMPDFPGYVVSTGGRAARLSGGRRQVLKPVFQHGRLYFRMRDHGQRKKIMAARAVARAFIKPELRGYEIHHRDGDPRNCASANLSVIPRITEGYRICKIDSEGRVMEEYLSAAEAARSNFMTYQTVLNRCRGVTADDFKHNRFSFRFKEDVLSQ